MISRRHQQGTTAVEFAIVGLVFFTVLIALIDFSRLFWDMAALDESTRRGARIAAVCPVNDPYVAEVALFGGLIPTLETQHISVQYLDAGASVVADPGGAGYGSIRYVRVSIQNFQLRTFIPGLPAMITPPSFETTIPSESLGRVGTVDVAC
ncbi:MAG: pilus assembly protein [Gammaproteobacteria bacterium]|nr:pilus assembly protein [Gammaproteobacteria bacterium]NNC56583.1 pilus assembly protein [Woeseiaceae bacterium]NNL49353.1 pilus assembly protein [Woeseiaceae bacterium]